MKEFLFKENTKTLKNFLLIYTISIFFFITFNTVIVNANASINIKVYYVSKDGDENGNGSKEFPFVDLFAFKQGLLKDINNEKIDKVKVIINEGEYFFPKGFTLNGIDLKGKDIAIEFIGKGDVTFTGAVTLDQNKFRNNYSSNIYTYDLSGYSLNFNIVNDDINFAPEFYVDNEPMILSRYPNEGFIRTGDVIANNKNDYEFKVGNLQLKCKDENYLYAGGYFAYDYNFIKSKCKVSDNSIQLVSDLGDTTIGEKKRFFIFNSLKELDSPKEYYIDYDKKLLYFYPPYNLENKSIKLSLLRQPIIAISNLNNISFENIKLEGCRSNAISISKGTNINFYNDSIFNISSDAIVLNDVNNSNIISCKIYNIGSSAIIMSGGNRCELIPANNTITNNQIFNCSRLKRTFSPAINIKGIGSTIRENTIHSSPYIGIWFSGNDNIIDKNEIYDICNEAKDIGAIYSGRNWTYRGNVIKNNYIHDIDKNLKNEWVVGIYMDDCMSSTEVYNNRLENVPLGMLFGGGCDHKIYSNTIKNCSRSVVFDDRGLNENWNLKELKDALTVVPYNNAKWTQRYPEIKSLDTIKLGTPYNNKIYDNVLINSGNMDIAESVKKNGNIKMYYNK